jgi:DNA-binding SARP family transcriptional activator
MRALVVGTLVLACSSSSKQDKPPQPTTPCGQSIAVVGGAIEATLARPDAEAFRMSAEALPARDCADIPELVADWEAYLKAPEPTRKRALLRRLEELAAQHRWIPSGSILRAIQQAKAD